jgi:hypothetical protein
MKRTPDTITRRDIDHILSWGSWIANKNKDSWTKWDAELYLKLKILSKNKV